MAGIVKVRGLNREEDAKELQDRIGLGGELFSDAIIYSDIEDWETLKKRLRLASERLSTLVISLYNTSTMKLETFQGGAKFTKEDAIALVDELISDSNFSIMHGVFGVRAILTCQLPDGRLITVFSDEETEEEQEYRCIQQVEAILLKELF